MNRRITLIIAAFSSMVAVLVACQKENPSDNASTFQSQSLQAKSIAATGVKEQLGRRIYFDKNLSNPIGQACASCHDPSAGFSDPNHTITSAGAVKGLFGNRNSPSSSYAMFAPSLHYAKDDETYEGGLFWDGRVNSLEEQSQKPFLNPLEMNNASVPMLVKKIKAADYYPLFVQVYGDIKNDNAAFNKVADAIAS